MTDFQSSVWALDLYWITKTGVNVLVSLVGVRISLSISPVLHPSSAVSQMSLLKCISLFADSLRSSYDSQEHLAPSYFFILPQIQVSMLL